MSTRAATPATEPDLATATATEHPPVLEELRRREPMFHHSEFGTTRADFERMTDEAFREIGALGRRYSREYVLAVLEERRRNPAEDEWEVRDFHCAESPRTAISSPTHCSRRGT